MKKHFNLTILIFPLVTLLSAQPTNTFPDNVRASNSIDAFTNTVSPGFLLYGMAENSGDIVGSIYLHDDWRKATIKIAGRDQEFRNYRCKLNLYANQLEVDYENSIRGIAGDKIESFEWSDPSSDEIIHYRNANVYVINNVVQSGFLEILVDGKIPLLKKTTVVIKKPDYNIQLNVGSKSTRINKLEYLYYVKENQLIELKTVKKKEFPEIFGREAPAITKFIKDESLKISEESDLVLIFEYYKNRLIKKEGA